MLPNKEIRVYLLLNILPLNKYLYKNIPQNFDKVLQKYSFS